MTLDIGFLGYRFMGKAHANALARLPMFFPDAPTVERSVLIGRSPEPLVDTAERLGFDAVETDWGAAFDEIDVFYNLGPTHVHVEPTVVALARDIPVLCEKPLAPRLAGAETVAAAARESDALTATGFNYRYLPALRLAKRMLDAGEFGDIRRFRGQYLQNWQADPEQE
jgi:predicted dehydrogenase